MITTLFVYGCVEWGHWRWGGIQYAPLQLPVSAQDTSNTPYERKQPAIFSTTPGKGGWFGL